MITVYFNAKAIKIRKSLTLVELLRDNGYVDGCFAVAVNRSFVSRNDVVNALLNEGDCVDVVTPMQGG
ncbi:hypothetical protein AQUSIP_23430 [Aquicella siphonis]|uniref:Sulfur carrier protein ThiS n=1 Tax=Aquicella siphonis TaxID=254247 RepID=A0A5E4PLA8_9COXI|nr:sulfur carrier protein ThiS [Aquicella siphonis]VVC77016.1 hypothetical protein AQUSIP_23430 [Aquicella siphonis]